MAFRQGGSLLRGFEPITSKNAGILVLGTFPSEASLQCGQYYGNKRNYFWPIISQILGQTDSGDYQRRKAMLTFHHIALWDVIESCERMGSADTAIKKESIKPNNLKGFLDDHPNIKKICFNGKKASTVYKTKCVDRLLIRGDVRTVVLPSTSPANARMPYKEKLKIWKEAIL
jgi:TDG/mug DNA glycosylase family protein